MFKHNQKGAANTVILLVLTILLLIGAIAFGVWSFAGRQDYKNNVDSKIATAVSAAKSVQQTTDNKQFAEDSKSPLRTYNGPEAYGSMVLNFPKTWSGYVSDKGASGNAAVDGYFYPNTVPSITDQSSVFALRVQVVNQPYSQVIQTYTATNTQQGVPPVSFSAYALPKVPKVVGLRATGMLSSGTFTNKQVDMVILPLRSETLEIWTEGSQFGGDFNTYILPNFSFSP